MIRLARCKDCISEKVCDAKNMKICLGIKVRDTIHECNEFRAKSYTITLPCEVGQRVYLITDKFTKSTELLRVLICRVDEFTIGFNNKTYAVLNAEDAFCDTRRFCAIDINEFGEKCFIERTYAEKKLSEILKK